MTRTAPAAPRTLSLLAARPLTLNTRPAQTAAAPAAPRPAGRPVVPVRWPGAPAAAHHEGPGTPAPAVQRAPAASPPVTRSPVHHAPGPAAVRALDPARPGPRPSATVQRVPVVRPAPPGAQAPGPGTSAASSAPSASVPARALPVSGPQAPPLAERPPAVPAPAPAAPVPVVRWQNPARAGAAGGKAPVVQRTGDATTPAAPTRGHRRSASVPGTSSGTSSGESSGSASGASSRSSSGGKNAVRRSAETPPDPGHDLDELARRLIDPVARLLRAELRRGRERTGRPHDGRR